MKKTTIYGLYLLLLAILPANVAGTAFLKQKYGTAVSVKYLNYNTHHFWSAKGKVCETYNDFSRNAVLGRIEFGLTSLCTLAASTSFNIIDESLNGKTHGFDDINLSIKSFLACKKGHLFCSEITAIIPTGGRKYELRYGRWGGQASLLYSKKFSVSSICGWYDTKVGYRFYEGYPSDQIRAKGVVGLCLTPNITLMGTAKLDYGLFNGERDPQNIIRYNSNFRLFKMEIEGFYRLWKRTYLSAGGFKHLWGRNVGTGSGVFGGLRVNF